MKVTVADCKEHGINKTIARFKALPFVCLIILMICTCSSGATAASQDEIAKARETYEALSKRNQLRVYERCQEAKTRSAPLEPICLVALGLADLKNQDPPEQQERVCAKKQPCACLEDGKTVECELGICGFKKGHYRSKASDQLAEEIFREYNAWRNHRISNVNFMGFADDAIWLEGARPKPYPVPEIITNCVAAVLGSVDYDKFPKIPSAAKDRAIAVLRGCQLKLILANSIDTAALSVLPTTAGAERKRAASISFQVLNACSEVTDGQHGK